MNGQTNGWIQLIMAAVAAFMQIWGAVHGVPIDPTHVAVAAALAANGAHHIKST